MTACGFVKRCFSLSVHKKHPEPDQRSELLRAETILSLIPDIIMEAGLDRKYSWANQAGYEFFGDSVIGKDYSYYFIDNQDLTKALEPLFTGSQETVYIESWQRRKDGNRRLLAWWCKGIRNSNGELTGTLSTARDITGQKNNELNLLQRTIELESFFNNSIDLLCIANTDGNLVRVNKQWEEVLGYSIKDLEGQKLIEMVHPEDVQMTIEAGTLGSNPKRITNFVNRYRHKNGSFRWISWSAVTIDTAVYASGKDITEERRIHESLRMAETRYKNLVDNSPVVNYQLDTNGIFMLSEGKGLTGLGLKPGEVVGFSVMDIYKDNPEIIHAFELAKSGKPSSFGTIVNGRRYDSFMEPVFDSINQVTSIIGVAVDRSAFRNDALT